MEHVPLSTWIMQALCRDRVSLAVLCGVLAIGAIVAVPAHAQDNSLSDVHITPRATPTPSPVAQPPGTRGFAAGRPMRVDVDLVLVPVTITDPDNRLVTGLEKENFQLFDAGQPQQIRHFSSEDAPVSIGVIFDISASMDNKIDKSREAIVEFFKTANPLDEFFVVSFNDKPEILADFTTDIDDIQAKLLLAVPRDRTSLLDAIYLGMVKMRQAKYQKKALLVISDGGDNHSRYTEDEIKSMVREADVQIYGIGIYSPTPVTPEEHNGPLLLAEVTDSTGGRTFAIESANELADVATKIGVELRNQYVLGYRPTNPARDGKWRKIKVKLNPPKGLPPLRVYAKTGYYAPLH